MFHVVYSRSYYDREHEGGHFESVFTLYRNCDYSQLGTFGKSMLEMLKSNADQKYADYQKDKNIDPTQCFHTEVYIVDDSDYFKTYNDEYDYHMPSGLTPIEEDYLHDYGQKNQFMLIKDFDPNYTWFGKDWTQEQIEAEYERRRLDNQARV
jgi:hypothetical protein